MSIWVRFLRWIDSIRSFLFSGGDEDPFTARLYYGCPESNKAAKLQMKQKLYR